MEHLYSSPHRSLQLHTAPVLFSPFPSLDSLERESEGFLIPLRKLLAKCRWHCLGLEYTCAFGCCGLIFLQSLDEEPLPATYLFHLKASLSNKRKQSISSLGGSDPLWAGPVTWRVEFCQEPFSRIAELGQWDWDLAEDLRFTIPAPTHQYEIQLWDSPVSVLLPISVQQ